MATDVDGADWLFNLLDGRPETYVAHAEDYYERTVSLSIVSHVFSQRRLTAQVAVALNPEADIELVSEKLGSWIPGRRVSAVDPGPVAYRGLPAGP